MDDEMAEAVEVFVCFEVDVDYEFDAPRFLDLGREETPDEARDAERWFDTARSYPPSPLIAKLNFGKDIHVENTGCVSHSSMLQVVSTIDHKSTVKRPSKRSTLMKPTASQLAKQNLPQKLKSSRFQQFEDDYAHHAPKRQRLERGHYVKLSGVKQQVDLFHKIPEKHFLGTKKNVLVDANNQHAKLKLTIPREPELRTARRALISRAQQLMIGDANCQREGTARTTSSFKALPLNRKILEAPTLSFPQKTIPRLPNFKEFNFRTHNRALIYRTTAPSLMSDFQIPTAIGETSVRSPCCTSGHKQLQDDGDGTDDGRCMLIKFKAQALNHKIIASKEDIEVFRSVKRETTIPKDFNLLITKRFQQAPLSELFNKLSLTSDAQRSTSLQNFQVPNHSDVKLFTGSCAVFGKNSKENLIPAVKQK